METFEIHYTQKGINSETFIAQVSAKHKTQAKSYWRWLHGANGVDRITYCEPSSQEATYVANDKYKDL